ncbi:MAG TPA: apolipoprotein N-acyltransferase, partial [Anaeromyxobacteraceae bacterium]|nr:apolipoprotein N-acyltransferase [Anaeromyxobacteraceae bacterium]
GPLACRLMSTALAARLDKPALAMAAGVLLALSMPPLGLYPLAWVALVPLLVRWEKLRHGWTLFREAYVAFLLMAVGAGFWVLFHEAMRAALFGGLGLLLLPIPHAAAFALAGVVRARYGLAVGLAALVCNVLGAEYLVSHLPGGLPWLLLGHTQAAALPLLQIADLGGVGLLSLFVLVANFFGFFVVRTAPRPGLLPGGRTLLALLFLAFLSGTAVYGDERLAQLAVPHGELSVSVVQPAEPTNVWGDVTDWHRVERLAALSDAARQGAAVDTPVHPVSDRLRAPRLLVWPEAALPPFAEPGAQDRLYRRLARWSDERDASLLTGALVQPAPGAPLSNAAVYLRRGQAAQAYDKVHLTPLVERLPFLETSPSLDAMTLPPGQEARLRAGAAPVVFEGAGYRVAPVIGFESLRGDYVRRSVAGGADVVVALSDGGWWGRAYGASQHLTLTRLRAVENRRAVVMATVSGTSALVYPDGRVEALAGWMEEGVAERVVPLQPDATLYTRHGDWPGRFAAFGMGWFLLVALASVLVFRKPAPPKTKREHA